MNNIVKENQRYYIRHLNRWLDGTITDDTLRDQNQMLTNMFEDFPEAQRQEILLRSMVEDLPNGDPSVIKQLIAGVKEHTISGDEAVALIDRFVDIPPAQREELKLFAREVYAGKVKTDEQTLEILQQEQQ
jgi:hypothetical protein